MTTPADRQRFSVADADLKLVADTSRVPEQETLPPE